MNERNTDEEDVMTKDDMSLLTMEKLAYLKKSTMNNLPMWTIHSVHGQPLGYAAEQGIAKQIARQNNLRPVSLH